MKPINSYPVRLATIERILAVVGLCFSIFMEVYLKCSTWAKVTSVNSPAFFPSLVAAGFLIVAALLFLTSFKTDKTKIVNVNLLGLLVCILWAVASILSQYIGFLLSSIIVLVITMVLWGVKSKLKIIITSVAVPVFFYLVFGYILHVRFFTLF